MPASVHAIGRAHPDDPEVAGRVAAEVAEAGLTVASIVVDRDRGNRPDDLAVDVVVEEDLDPLGESVVRGAIVAAIPTPPPADPVVEEASVVEVLAEIRDALLVIEDSLAGIAAALGDEGPVVEETPPADGTDSGTVQNSTTDDPETVQESAGTAP